MPIRPIDVRRKEFKSGFRGYDANQVDDFLDSVADEFERSYTENQRMREEVSSLRERLQQFEDLEGSIRAALVHAETAANDLRRSAAHEAEDVKRSAQREADLTIQEAHTRSRQMLADSSLRVERVQGSYEALQEAKRSFADDFRGLLKTYMDVMENVDVSSAREMEASLRGRLDTEALAAAREAAQEQEAEERAAARPAAEQATGVATPGATDGEADGAFDDGRTVSGHAIVGADDGGTTGGSLGTGFDAAAGPGTGATREEGAPAPVADEISSSDDSAATQVLGPMGASPEGDSSKTQDEAGPAGTPETEAQTGDGVVAGAPPDAREPDAREPVADPSAAAAEEVGRDEAETPLADEPALAEESGSQDFFEQKGSSGREERGESRVSRASRFLRRRE